MMAIPTLEGEDAKRSNRERESAHATRSPALTADGLAARKMKEAARGATSQRLCGGYDQNLMREPIMTVVRSSRSSSTSSSKLQKVAWA